MGAINIKHTGSGSDITLSSDGTDLLLDGSAIGGLPELYAENPSSPTAPSAAGANGIAIGSNATNTTVHGSGNALAIGTDAVADYYATSLGAGTDATGNSSLALGYNAQAVGAKSTAIMRSYASGTTAFAAVIDNNTSSYGATGANSIAMGYLAKATGSTNGSVAIGYQANATAREAVAIGSSALASGNASVALGGYFGTSVQARATGTAAFAVAGYNGLFNNDTTASGFSSVALSGGNASQTQSIALGISTASIKGKLTKGAFPFGTDVGTTQYGLLVLQNQTTDNTPATLVSDSDYLAPSTDNQIILPNNSAYAFHGTVVARQQAADGTACAAWKIEGLIRREGSAGTTVLVNSATTVLDNTPGWGMALSADTTNGGLKIEVTGAAATNIRWVATIHTSEVTY